MENRSTRKREERFFVNAIVLFRTKNPIPCISQTWADVSVFIQAAIDMTDIDLDIRMCLMQSL